MWQYQNTDELYYSNMYKSISKKLDNELYHSDVYFGKDFSDGIKHFKYIKREKVNGRWRYYYKNDKLDQLGREKNDAMDMLREENKLRGYGNNTYSNSNDKSKSYNHISNNGFAKSMAYAKEEYKDRKRKDRYNKYIKALNVTSDAVYKGKQKVSKAIDNIKKKIKKKASDINKKYKIVSTHHTSTTYGIKTKPTTRKWVTYD